MIATGTRQGTAPGPEPLPWSRQNLERPVAPRPAH